MIHKCKVQCHSVNPTEMDLLGIKEDSGKWLPFAIDMGVITAVKMSTDEKGEATYNCSTIFCNNGDSFILDTSYMEMVDKWESYVNFSWTSDDESSKDEDDLNL